MNFPRKVFGVSLIVLSIVGLIVSIFAVVQVWRFRLPVATQTYDSLVFAEKVVNTSISGLDVIDSSLTNIRTSLDSLEESTLLMAQSLEDTSNLIDSFSNLFKSDIKETLENTKISVVAAQSSALIIDNLLYGLSRLPFLGIVYDPPQPLNEALSEIGDTLTDMPQSMDDISVNLTDSNQNLNSLKTGIDGVADSLAGFQTDITNAQGVITTYLTDLHEIKSSLINAQEKIFNWSIWIAIIMSIMIVLIGVAQVAAIQQGYEMYHYEKNLDLLIEKKIIEYEKNRSLGK
jgi:TM2 domain-containing membrane protein YozV